MKGFAVACCAVAGAVICLNGKDGWGWFLLASILIAVYWDDNEK